MTTATGEEKPPRVIAVSGSTGLIGRALVSSLRAQDRTVLPLVRGGGDPDGIAWYPDTGQLDLVRMEGVEAAVHLAGEPVGERWSAGKKLRIRRSRVEATRELCEALSLMEQPPNVLVCASAIGYFGDRGDEMLVDESPPGTGFLASTTRDWEAAAEPARKAGIRVVHLRFGVVLSRRGGALARLLTPFRLGVGGRLGSGRQWMSWISLEDALGVIEFALDNPGVAGGINAVAPEPVTNAEFTGTLGSIIHRPTVLPVPGLALRMLFGEMAQETLLASQRALPRRLMEEGYVYRHPRLPEALRAAVASAPRSGS